MVNEAPELKFVLKSSVFDKEANLSNLTLPLVQDFIGDVMNFLKGGERGLDLDNIKASLTGGSVAVAVKNENHLIDKAYEDYVRISLAQELDPIEIAPQRQAVIEKWQGIAVKKNRSYEVIRASKSRDLDRVVIDSKTRMNFKQDLWVDIEDYTYGQVYNMGGKDRANIHMDAELGHGRSDKINADKNDLVNNDGNRLYKNQLVRIRAKKNVRTGQLKDRKMISFENYNPGFDEEEFEEIARKTREAWKDIPDLAEWVEELRGNDGSE